MTQAQQGSSDDSALKIQSGQAETGLVDCVTALLQADAPSEPLPPSLEAMKGIVETNRLLQQAKSTGASESIVAGVRERLTADPKEAQFTWSITDDVPTRQNAMAQLVDLPQFKPPESDADGIKVGISEGDRTQLRAHFTTNTDTSVFCHFVLKAGFEGVSEAYVAFRWLHGDDDEEVIVRLRTTTLVVGQAIELNVSPSNHFNLISIGRRDNCDVVLLNGIPVYWCHASTPMPTGIVLDFIASTGGQTTAVIPLLVINQDAQPFWCSEEDAAQFQNIVLSDCATVEKLKVASLWLHALRGVEPGYVEQSTAEPLLVCNQAQTRGFQDYVTELLLEKVSPDVHDTLCKIATSTKPTPSARFEDVTVEISSNPSLNATLQAGFSRNKDTVALLDGINFDVFSGDIVGIIGKNGAGKTTFLKTLVASMPLSRGRICVDNRPILLRPGAGMQGDLTGRENVLKTGLYMGFLPQEMAELMDDIVSFAELEDHIDRPFRYYSDGMRARLIFALATAVPRDVLLLDELLSAGDLGFQKKAMGRLHKFIAKARLVFVVQHTFDFVLSRCTKCLLLEQGRQVYFGDPRIATELYRESL